MRASEMLHERLRRRKTDERSGHEFGTNTGGWRAGFDGPVVLEFSEIGPRSTRDRKQVLGFTAVRISRTRGKKRETRNETSRKHYLPTTRRIHTQYRHPCLLQRSNHIAKWLSHLPLKTEPKNRIDHMMRLAEQAAEVFSEGDVEVVQLGREAGVELVGCTLGEEDCGRVAVVVEMPGCYEAVAAWEGESALEGGRFLRWGCELGGVGRGDGLPLLPGPQATRMFLPLLGGWTR